MDKRQWIVYLVRCSDESLYCGITNNLKNRLIAHNSGRGAKYTRSRRPVELVGASPVMTKSDALKLEYRVKHVSAGSKYYVLIKEEDKMTMQLKKDLQAISRELKTLAKKIEKIDVAMQKLEKPKPVKKAAKAKPVKKTAAKKTPPKSKPAKKVVPKKPDPIKAAKVTASDTVFALIEKSKQGVDAATLMEKTGFNRKKIANMVMILKKKGIVTSPQKGVYVKA
jgi:putative endonuclease